MGFSYKLRLIVTIISLFLFSPNVDSHEFRVAIKTNSFARLNHKEVVISSDGEQIMVIDSKNNINSGGPIVLKPSLEGIVISYEGGEQLMDTTIWVYPEHECRLIIDSIVRGDAWEFNPSYRGFLEINLSENQLQVINTVTVEQYLYGVVPSEMVSSWPLEALKAQAVASRTYVARAIAESKIAGRNYHIDDSVFAQVYNNRREDPKAKLAVDSTEGIVMLDDYGHLIRAYFHSTSCGITASSHEVWSGGTRESFPTSTVPYLIARPVTMYTLDVDFENEQEISNFFTNKEIISYEQQSPWFRWHVSLTRDQLEGIINENLIWRHHVDPEFVLTQGDNGEFESLPILHQAIGELQDISVIRRGAGGNVMILELSGTGGVYRVYKELNVRYVLRPQDQEGNKDITINRMMDEVLNYPILPSANIWFNIERNARDAIEKIDIYGGGNGHGVGMSQWGAKGMAEAGFNYEEILESFYQGISFFDIKETDWLNLVGN